MNLKAKKICYNGATSDVHELMQNKDEDLVQNKNLELGKISVEPY